MFIKKDIVKSTSLWDVNDKKLCFLSSKQNDIVIRQAQFDLFALAGVILPKNKNSNPVNSIKK